MTKKFTLEEFRNYLNSQDSLGDIHYNLSEENIAAANKCEECVPDEDPHFSDLEYTEKYTDTDLG